MSLFAELKRRNVVRMGIAYAAVAWLLIEVSDTVLPRLGLPDWTVTFVIVLLMLGFPLALFFSWAYQVTPDGIKLESEIDGAQSVNHLAGRKLDHAIVFVLVIALAYFAFDKFVLGPQDESALVEDTSEAATESAAGATDAAAEPHNSIAVLPFVNMSSDKEQEYFSDGLSEELATLLARIPDLHVAARTSSFSFKGKNLGVPEIAARLNVAHVLEGSVRKHDNQIRITAQLIQADNGYQLWSETYDRQLDNIFHIQEQIAIAVVDALRITLLGEAPKARKTEPAAYQLFLEGLHLKRQLSGDSLHKAIEAFNQAVEIDPSYAPAWAELADTYIWGGGSHKFSREERVALADQAVQKAISIDPAYAFAYYVRGISWIFTKYQFDRGIEDFEHALELEPDNAFMVAAIGKGALVTGKFDLAITQFQAALALEPVVPEFHYFLGKAHLSAGRLDAAEASFRKTLDLSPTAFGQLELWETLFLKGELEAALEQAESLQNPTTALAVTHYALGNMTKADEYLAESIALHAGSGPYAIAKVYGFRGEADKTFEWLDDMVQKNGFPTFILGDTALRSVYSDPRWPPFLAELGLLGFWLEMPSTQAP
jgi:adenylate cyclase